MVVPFATTTIAVLRVPADASRDPYDAQPEPDVVASADPAHGVVICQAADGG